MFPKSLIQMFQQMNELFNEDKRFTDLDNLDELRKKGEVVEETETNGDLITKRIQFKSSDGSVEIFRSTTTNKSQEKYSRISELRSKINRLLRDEKYEDAIPLRDELHKLESELKQTNKKEPRLRGFFFI